MVHASEAACLLQTGALYTRRLGFKPVSGIGDDIFVGIKAGAFSIYFGDAPIVHYDLEGRWQRAFIEGIHYLKGLDTTTQAMDRVREGANMVLKRRTLSYAEASDVDALVRSYAIEIGDQIDRGALQPSLPPAKTTPLDTNALRHILDQIGLWDATAWFSHREKYLAAYGPLPFLPPDCQHAVILQATLGHPGSHAFGNGKGSEYYARSPIEFARHVADVAKLLGRRAEQCRNIFLAGGDVLTRPLDDLLEFMNSIEGRFPLDPGIARIRPTERQNQPHRFEGVQVFLDDFHGPLPDQAGFEALKCRHLAKVHLGIASGDATVRTNSGRTWSNDQIFETVRSLKGANLAIGIIVLVGAGGNEFAEAHVEASATLLNTLPLSAGDLVVLIDADEIGPMPNGLSALSPNSMTEQRSRLRERLAPIRTERGAKVVPYSLEKQGALS